ncbi:MAG: hypothetical protein AB4911_19560 [Oscillochloridaceae bacterium umkhey_bin13]
MTEPHPAAPSIQLEQALSARLPADLRMTAPDLAALFAGVLSDQLTIVEVEAHLSANPQLQAALRSLAGRQITSNQAVIHFGTGTQLGDIRIGTIAGRDIVLNVNLADDRPQRRRFVMLGIGIGGVALLVLAVLVLFNQTTQRQLHQTEAAISADVISKLSNLDAQLGFVDTTLRNLPDNQASTTWSALLTRSAIADLRQAIGSRPIRDDQGAIYAQNLVNSGANPDLTNAFYTNLQIVVENTESLLLSLENLAEQPVDRPQWRTYYAQIVDLNHRRLQTSATILHLTGLRILNSHHAIDQRNALLANLRHLQPTTLPTPAAIDQALQEQVRMLEQLVREREQLIREAEALFASDLQIQANDTWEEVIGKAISLRKLGFITEAQAAFARYGELFSATDLTASDYALTAQAFTTQIAALGVEGGAYIFQIEPESRAAAVGLRVGDIVIKLNNQAIANVPDFIQALGMIPPDQAFALSVLRREGADTFVQLVVTLDGQPIGIGYMPI